MDLETERACFHGVFLSFLTYGALWMLYVQLTQVLLARPKRGQTFWAIVAYSATLFPLASIVIGVTVKFSEKSFVDDQAQASPDGAFYCAFSTDRISLLGQICTTIFPWFADLLMLSRLVVVWNYKWWIMVFPALAYLSHIAMSIPLLAWQVSSHNPTWMLPSAAYGIVYHALSVAFNLYIAVAICIRLCTMRKKLEIVTGRLAARFYTSSVTLFVEAGVLFVVWDVAYLVVRAQGSVTQSVFVMPCTYVLGITRMLVVLRIAQDRAWSKDLVTAMDRGILDWQVSSTHSVPFHDAPSGSMTSFHDKTRLRKDSIAMTLM